MNLKKLEMIFITKLVETGPSSYKKIIYQAAVLTKVEKHWFIRTISLILANISA